MANLTLPRGGSRTDWFLYADRNEPPVNPIEGSLVWTDRFAYERHAGSDDVAWESSEVLIRSVLVPAEAAESAADDFIDAGSGSFGFGWGGTQRFEFGEEAQIGGLTIYPWTYSRTHPIDRSLVVELRQDFIHYHMLDLRSSGEYFHPLDTLRVAQTGSEKQGHFNPTARVAVHVDYLRDYLAARRMALLISVIGDRFANAESAEALEVEAMPYTEIAPRTWLRVDVLSAGDTGSSFYRGRSTLWRNVLVLPHERPKVERSPWYHGVPSVPESEQPLFILNAEGKKGPAMEAGPMAYLYFRRDVLQKYLSTPGYSVGFHMRTWGAAAIPGGGEVVLGINSHGLVNAYALDISDLPAHEQAYWSSFSSLPSGEICWEMWETRMQQRPPHSPSVTELIENGRKRLDGQVMNRAGSALYSGTRPADPEMRRLTVGPLTEDTGDVVRLAEILYKLAVEPMQIKALRDALPPGSFEDAEKQIALLTRLLQYVGIDPTTARSMTNPLRGLNEMRIGADHIGSVDIEKAFQLMGHQQVPQGVRAMWDACVDATAACLEGIAAKFRPLDIVRDAVVTN